MARYRLPRPPSFDEADVSDKPSLIRDDPAAGRRRRRPPGAQPPGPPRRRSSPSTKASRSSVATLRRTGQLRNTVIVFVSDNGWVQGEHRIPGDKFVPYEESIHVPLVLSGPGIPRGRTVDNQVAANVDLTPDAPGARPRPGRPDARRPVAAALRRTTPAPPRTGRSRSRHGQAVRGRGLPAGVGPGLQRPAVAAVEVRAVELRRPRALRPAPRPVRAAQPRRRAALRRDGGPARASARRAGPLPRSRVRDRARVGARGPPGAPAP